MNNLLFYNFPRITVAVYFTYFESIIVYRLKALLEQVLCLKRLITSAFGSSEPFSFAKWACQCHGDLVPCHAKSGPDQKWTGDPIMATKSGPPGPLLVAIIGPPVYFSLQKAVHPSEKWTGCSFRSLARLWGYKKHY